MTQKELNSKIKDYVEKNNLNKDLLTCNELDQIANACKCKRVDVMSWFRFGRVI